MNAIASNPFRTLGAWTNALASEIVNNRGRMTTLIKMGRGADSPLDLTHILGPVERTADILTDAEAHLTVTDERLLAAQFWFINLTADDVLAAQHLAAGRSDQALALWQGRNSVSALQNSAVLHLALGDTASATRAVAQLYGEHADEFISALRLDHTVTAAELVRNYTSTLAAQCPDADLSALMPHDGSSEHIPVPEQSIPVTEHNIPEPEQSIPAEEVAIVTPHTHTAPVPPVSPTKKGGAKGCLSMIGTCLINLLIFGGYKACRNSSMDTTQHYDVPKFEILDSTNLPEPVDIDIPKFEIPDVEPPEVPEFDFRVIPEINIPDLPEPPNHDNVNEETSTKTLSTQEVIDEATPLTPPSTQDVPHEQ